MSLGAGLAGRVFLLDLDGVVWIGSEPIDGSPEAVAALQNAKAKVGFVTNMSMLTRAQQREKLAAAGIQADEGQIITSAMAAATLISAGDRVVVCGGEGIAEAVRENGGEVVDAGPAEAVIVGMHPGFDMDQCTIAMRAVREGARLIGSNHDPTYPTPKGLRPGGGSVLAAVAAASETEPEMAGKPNAPMVNCIRKVFGEPYMVVGDRPDSDGLLAQALGCSFAHVLSGVGGDENTPQKVSRNAPKGISESTPQKMPAASPQPLRKPATAPQSPPEPVLQSPNLSHLVASLLDVRETA